MNKKELAERVRLTDEETVKALREEPAFNCRYDTGVMRAAKSVAQAQLNKVLNDPDLALIDRGKEFVIPLGSERFTLGYKQCLIDVLGRIIEGG